MYSKTVTIFARIETHLPCLTLLIAVSTGQLVAESILVTEQLIFAVMGFGLLAFILLRARLFRITLGFLIGVLSSLSFLQTFPVLASSEEYVSGFIDTVRYPKPGSVTFSLHSVGGPALFCKALHLPWRESSALVSGSNITAYVTLTPLQRSMNPFAADRVLWRRGYSGRCSVKLLSVERSVDNTFRSIIRDFVESTVGEGERSGLILAMSLGFRDLLSDRTENAFRILGLSHLLVFSGYQVGLVFGIILFLIDFAGRKILHSVRAYPRRIIVSVLSFFLTALFVALIGFEASSVRALISAAVIVVARIFEYKIVGIQMLSSALIVGLVVEPGALFEPSLDLTAAALFGMWLGSGPTPWGRLANLIRVSICASLTAGLIAFVWFGSFSIISPVLNPILAPTLSCIGCPVALAAIALATLGQTWMLQMLATFFQEIAFLIVALARSRTIESLAQPWAMGIGATLSGIFLLRRLQRKLREGQWALGM